MLRYFFTLLFSIKFLFEIEGLKNSRKTRIDLSGLALEIILITRNSFF